LYLQIKSGSAVVLFCFFFLRARYYCSGAQISRLPGNATECGGDVSTACEPGKICDALGMTAGKTCPAGCVLGHVVDS
jgi:hypothetical protein